MDFLRIKLKGRNVWVANTSPSYGIFSDRMLQWQGLSAVDPDTVGLTDKETSAKVWINLPALLRFLKSGCLMKEEESFSNYEVVDQNNKTTDLTSLFKQSFKK